MPEVEQLAERAERGLALAEKFFRPAHLADVHIGQHRDLVKGLAGRTEPRPCAPDVQGAHLL